MSIVAQDQDRRVIPRWRDLKTTILTGELDTLGTSTPRLISQPQGDFLATKLADWKANKSALYATDLVAAAFVLGRDTEAEEAAQFILAIPNGLSPMATSIARKVIGLAPQDVKDREERSRQLGIGELRRNIHKFREQLRDDPRNALMWAELARQYAVLGLQTQAGRAMENAIKLAPTNRFILRSAARLYVHLNEPDRAHHLLSRNEATKTDPWLIASEISTAMIAHQKSHLTRRARFLLKEKKHRLFHLSELASAVGTLELYDGHRQRARKLLTEALVEPTDNTVAQAEWATRKIGDFSLNPKHLEVPYSFEARAWASYFDGKWTTALDECSNWMNDEPFSSRPADLGSFIATVALEDYSQGKEFARRGLIANQKDHILLNNLVFALASENKVEEATIEYQKIDPSNLPLVEKIPWLATGGLLAFRSGLPATGRGLYEEAMLLAKDDPFRLALAAIYLAREELLAKTPDAMQAVERALRLGERVKFKVVQHLTEKLRFVQPTKTPSRILGR